MTSSQLVMLDADELSRRIKLRNISCREVMVAYLDQIERFNPTVNAMVSLRPRAELLAQADQADSEIRSGHRRGWMHGFPHAVKDLAATKDISTTRGSPLFEDAVPGADAIFVERLRANGAIIIGKTNTSEFGLGSHTYNPVFGTTRNAYDPSKTAGGSSGGAAVGLALRMLPVADGSDFAGSLRNPAGWNNVFGFRPSAGRVPFGPTADVFVQQLASDGPMAWTVTDLAMLLSVMAGYDPRAPLSLTEDPSTFAAPLGRDFKGTRIGWLGDLSGALPTEPGVLELGLSGTRALESAGCIIEEAKFDISAQLMSDTWLALRHWLVGGLLAEVYSDPEKRTKLKPEAIWEVEGALRLSAMDIWRASVGRTKIYDAFRRAFERYDFLALPTAQLFPFDADVTWPREIAEKRMEAYHCWMEITFPATMAGCPTVAVPVGFGGPASLPLGIQIIGPRQHDFAALQLAHAHEQVTGWTQKCLPPAFSAC
jgi:amidase